MKRLTEEDIIARAEARRWRNNWWTALYRTQRRIEAAWISVFLLLFCLLGLIPIIALLFARYGK